MVSSEVFYLTTHNVSYLHEMVIHNVCKMICWKAVRFHQDKIIFGLLLTLLRINGVTEHDWCKVIASQAHDVTLALLGTF